MEKLVRGIHHFQKHFFSPQRELFEHLAHGQTPDTLFITCSDSRIVPSQFTQTDPGDLFIMRNAGNLVPPWGATNGGEGATVEYAVQALGVAHIIVCGHSHCGAITALLDPKPLVDMPAVSAWLSHAEATRRIMRDAYQDLAPAARLDVAVRENVLCQLENLRTHPSVAGPGHGQGAPARLGLYARDRRGLRLRPRPQPVRAGDRARAQHPQVDGADPRAATDLGSG